MLTIALLMGTTQLWAATKDAEGATTWFDGQNAVSYYVEGKTDLVVGTALDMFSGDMQQVTGMRPVAKKTDATIHLLQLDKASKSALGKWRQRGLLVDSLLKVKDGFQVKAVDGRIYVAGSNGRGVAYGLLELSREAGVSPWVWWSDVVPERRTSLTLPPHYDNLQTPSVEYRGIFLNDEDWSLQPWSWQTFEKGNPVGMIGAKTYKEIFKLLLRLRANMIWPGMHGMTMPFYKTPGAREVADSCGIVIGTSHCEPMMRNNVGEWDVDVRGRFNYITNRDEVQRYWTERLREVGMNENFYTMGMRGIHDGPMEGVKGRKETTKALQQVINDQRELLRKYVNRDVTKIPQSFVPYKEVLQIMDSGLDVPEDITLVWCDDNYGYMTRLSDSLQQKRSGGGGIYYHLSYWGRPHDYMWLACTQPGLIYNEMRQAYDHNVRKLWITNVHDMKTAAYPLELFLDLAWNIDGIKPQAISQHQQTWLCREFGVEVGKQLAKPMHEFYRLTAIRRPEFMGWTQNELDKKVYHRGLSPVKDTEFSFTEFGGEADRYLADWEAVRLTVLNVEKKVPERLRDAYFSHVKYPLLGAAAMSRKMLEAQRARAIACGDYHEERWTRHDALYTACARSQQAYQEIRQLTDYWNNQMAGGRWRGSMCDHPRDQYVFYAPNLPVALTDTEAAQYSSQSVPSAATVSQPLPSDSTYIAFNAYRYQQASGTVEPIQMLGHSMQAVSVAKGSSLTYEFDTEQEGEARLTVAVIPTQPNDRGDIRFSVQIDGGEPQVCSFKEGFRTESWKQNVLRAQALRHTQHTLAKGHHTLTLRALDDHIVFDQWIIDFQPDRQYYVIPAE